MLRVARIEKIDIHNAITRPATSVWFAGCSLRCEGCQNPGLWDRSKGYAYTPTELIRELIGSYPDVVLIGGEPLDQHPKDLERLVFMLYNMDRSIWLYTGHELDDIPGEVSQYCHTIKTGRYKEELATPKARLASSNQKFWRWQNMGNGSKTLKEIHL